MKDRRFAMRFALILGSIGSNSYNRKLATFIQKRYQDQMDIEILSLEDVPMFNVDIGIIPRDY